MWKVRCERDRRVFRTRPTPYPIADNQTHEWHSDGDEFIMCPKCHRSYFRVDEAHLDKVDEYDMIITGPAVKAGDFFSDRVLTIISKE